MGILSQDSLWEQVSHEEKMCCAMALLSKGNPGKDFQIFFLAAANITTAQLGQESYN